MQLKTPLAKNNGSKNVLPFDPPFVIEPSLAFLVKSRQLISSNKSAQLYCSV